MDTKHLISAAALLACVGSVAAQGTPVRVTAWGQHYAGQVLYKYDVQNLGTPAIRRVRVGYLGDGTLDAALTAMPLSDGNSRWLAKEAYRSPDGWGASMQPTEERETFTLDLIEGGYLRELAKGAAQSASAPPALPGNQGLLPGTTTEFSVFSPEVDPAYVQGVAVVTSGAANIHVPVVKGDSIPPTIMLRVDRVNQNNTLGTWAIFNMSYSVADNYDPAPAYSFDPITANQPVAPGDIVVDKNNARAWNVRLRNVPGRTYTLRVTATDASGNEAVKTYEYSVPR